MEYLMLAAVMGTIGLSVILYVLYAYKSKSRKSEPQTPVTPPNVLNAVKEKPKRVKVCARCHESKPFSEFGNVKIRFCYPDKTYGWGTHKRKFCKYCTLELGIHDNITKSVKINKKRSLTQ